jgi:hypothetical protein
MHARNGRSTRLPRSEEQSQQARREHLISLDVRSLTNHRCRSLEGVTSELGGSIYIFTGALNQPSHGEYFSA